MPLSRHRRVKLYWLRVPRPALAVVALKLVDDVPIAMPCARELALENVAWAVEMVFTRVGCRCAESCADAAESCLGALTTATMNLI